MINRLTPEQEEKMFDDFQSKIFRMEGPTESIEFWNVRGNIIKFARIYHTEARKTAVSGEVKSPEEYLCRIWSCQPHEIAGYVNGYMDKDLLEYMLQQYAAQFESKWLPIEEANQFANQTLFVATLENEEWVYSKAVYIKRGNLDFLHVNGVGNKPYPTRFMIPQPPTQ